jgi:glutamate decarboxylase
MSWNFQKGLGVPVYCSAVVINGRPGILEAANSAHHSDYIFHDHPAREWDLGAKSLQCGRRPDSLKMWLCWKRFGSDGFAKRVDKAIANSQYLASQIRARGDAFHLVTEPVYANCCWHYVPKALRPKVAAEGIESIYHQLEDITMAIKTEYQRRGTMLIDVAPLTDKGIPKFFRIILNMPTVTTADMDYVLNEIEDIGEALFPDQM